MDMSRESQMLTKTSEVEESADVRDTSNRSFLLSIGYFGWSSCFQVVHSTKEIMRYSEHFFKVKVSNTGLNI